MTTDSPDWVAWVKSRGHGKKNNTTIFGENRRVRYSRSYIGALKHRMTSIFYHQDLCWKSSKMSLSNFFALQEQMKADFAFLQVAKNAFQRKM